MNVEFENPIVPNFIRTKNLGVIPLEQLDEEEILYYIELFSEAIKVKYYQRRGDL